MENDSLLLTQKVLADQIAAIAVEQTATYSLLTVLPPEIRAAFAKEFRARSVQLSHEYGNQLLGDQDTVITTMVQAYLKTAGA